MSSPSDIPPAPARAASGSTTASAPGLRSPWAPGGHKFNRAAALGVLVIAAGLDLAGHTGHLGFVIPCTAFALLLGALLWSRPRPVALPVPWQPPALATAASDGTAAPAANDLPGSRFAETQLSAPPSPPLPGLMALLDVEGRVLAASPALARWLQTDRDRLVGQTLEQIFGDEAGKQLRPQFSAALGGSLRRFRCLHIDAKGSRRWLQTELQARFDEYGERIGCDLLAMDITPEQRRLEKLVRHERRTRQLLDRMAAPLVYLTRDGVIRFINGAEERWLGLTANTVVDCRAAEVPGSGWAQIEPQLQAVFEGRSRQLRRFRVHPDGRRELQVGEAVLDRDDQGRAVGLFLVFVDETEVSQLRQRVDDCESQLRMVRAGLLAPEDVELPEPQTPPAETAAGPTGDGRDLALSLDDFQPLVGHAPAQAFAMAPGGPLVESVEACVHRIARAAQPRSIELGCRFGPRLPQRLHQGLPELQQALQGLFDAALAGGETTELWLEVQRIDESLLSLSLEQRLSATDADPAGTDQPAVLPQAVRDGVQAAGGRCGIDAEPGLGRRLWITWPLDAAARQEAPAPAGGAATGPIGSGLVLVVDDSARQRELLGQLLAELGLTTTGAADGEEALRHIREAQQQGQCFDAVLVDSELPDLEAAELALRIRACEPMPPPAMVLLDTAIGPEAWADAAEAGMLARVDKPVRVQELRQVLTRLLARPAPRPSEAPNPQRHAPLLVDQLLPEGFDRGWASGLGRLDCPTIHARVLMAEGHAVNQVLTQVMLDALDCDYEIVDNGAQAMAALQREHFDLLLLDVRTSELDGPTVARRVRERERNTEGRRRMPLIGLIDIGAEDDRQACLDAGMDACLVRPYNRQQLTDLLMRWLPPQLIEQPQMAARLSIDEAPLAAPGPLPPLDPALLAAAVDEARAEPVPSETPAAAGPQAPVAADPPSRDLPDAPRLVA